MSEDGSERRRDERVDINREFDELDVAPSGAPGSTWVSNLSISGVFVHTLERPEIGEQIELRFTIMLDDPVIVDVFGKVVRHSEDPPGMGVEFESVDDEAREAIESSLERLRPRDSGAPLGLARFVPPPLPSQVAAAAAAATAAATEEDDEDATSVFPRPAPVRLEGPDGEDDEDDEVTSVYTGTPQALDEAPTLPLERDED
ncbi:PilZ domain-containing protein [Pseudenhygromyxa sp. WMMC2535]|uniref:PilZ domain-containing protein n=1 Tax=Pseudenhygromyxa sp. WMMC2535 TaxID=2712867 RepID=UPI0015550582|nr:PilZ domain-containing protein [Pseudenhygromyxa sp. WMMC2535]NVB38798.1 PilZ domain-containing protein [Pseudenhygromyxa sp. WMMC2535]